MKIPQKNVTRSADPFLIMIYDYDYRLKALNRPELVGLKFWKASKK